MAEFLSTLADHDVLVLAGLVDPLLAAIATEGVNRMRRLCRLCDRTVCDPCPAEVPQDRG